MEVAAGSIFGHLAPKRAGKTIAVWPLPRVLAPT